MERCGRLLRAIKEINSDHAHPLRSFNEDRQWQVRNDLFASWRSGEHCEFFVMAHRLEGAFLDFFISSEVQISKDTIRQHCRKRLLISCLDIPCLLRYDVQSKPLNRFQPLDRNPSKHPFIRQLLSSHPFARHRDPCSKDFSLQDSQARKNAHPGMRSTQEASQTVHPKLALDPRYEDELDPCR